MEAGLGIYFELAGTTSCISMSKDFPRWLERKKIIDENRGIPLFHALEVWWCSIGANVGYEADGKQQDFVRPVVIYRKFGKDMFWGIPVSSKIRSGVYYHTFTLHENQRTALLSQIRVLSPKRLLRKIGKMTDHQFASLSQAMQMMENRTDPLRGPQVPNGNLQK